ncbi:hypothetical protein PYW08_007209 [Mythimna loreyi]|uniref:Uncharacterized protein n=1 Tax=Mythimna loreyi TaxID=667449 RepID=A0ACC2RAD3_9NEOP|nr:hypothetical protein PYW08_007209 [Mythimna loreyi]
MVKIILIIAIAALACVNGQNGFLPGFGPEGPFGLLNHQFFRNIRIPRPQDIKPGPNTDYHAMYVESNGNQMFFRKNDNGKESEFVIHH